MTAPGRARRLCRRVRAEQGGSQTVEYLLATPLALALLALILGQLTAAALGLIACEAAARDAALAAARGHDPVVAARRAAPGWHLVVSPPERAEGSGYEGIRVRVTLTVPGLPVRLLAGRSLAITRWATVPAERGWGPSAGQPGNGGAPS